MRRFCLVLFFLLSTSIPVGAQAAISLVDKDDWKVQLSGFAELDMFADTRRSFPELVGNRPVDAPGSLAGSNGRMQQAVRNSRLAFSVLPPESDGWKSKGYLEFDLMGFDPDAGSTNTEAGFYSSPTLRVRHAYFSVEKEGWQLLAGQSWTLFGWQPTYNLTTVSVSPGPGMLNQRTPQITLTKAVGLGERSKLTFGLSAARPSQRDSNMPNLEAGVRYAYAGLSSGYASASGDVKAEPLSVGLSATHRSFAVSKSATVTDGLSKTSGDGLAIDVLVPVLPASDDGKETAHSLTLTGEFTTGKGFGDAFPSWTGNLAQLPVGSTPAPNPPQSATTNLDPGQAGWNSSGGFELLKLQSWSAQLQYHLPGNARTFVTIGHSELRASNINGLLPAALKADNATYKTVYRQVDMNFVNVFHDFTAQIRGGAEYAKFTTTYVSEAKPVDERYQVSAYFRF